MTLAEIRKDKRVCSVENIQDEDWINGDIKYELELEDGYYFTDGSTWQGYCTVKEMSDDLDSIVTEEEAKRRHII